MPNHLLQDIENVSPAGKTVCGIAFMLGAIALTIQAATFGTLPQKIKMLQSEGEAKTFLPHKPEELTLAIPPFFPPKTDAEKTQRKIALETRFEELQNALDATSLPPVETPEELIAFGVVSGNIHPLDADRLLEETKGIPIKKDGKVWVTEQ